VTVDAPTDIPLVGAVDDVKPEPGDDRFWSVTTIIGALDKPALVHWSAIETAKAAVDGIDIVQSRLRNEGRDSAIDYLKGARFRRPPGQRGAAELGTAVHAACEQYALTGTRPDVDGEVAPFVVQFDRFLQEFQPRYVATEVTVYEPEYSYAGTSDAFLNIDGMRLIVDYKTSRESFDAKGNPKGPYPEVALQLAAYRHASLAAVWRARRFESFRRRYYLLSAMEKAQAAPVPEVDGGVVIYLTPDRYGVYPVRCDESVFEQFLYVIEAARWSFETSKAVIGHPMMPPHPQPEDDPFKGLPT
jgi:hypothetical protein